MGKAGRFACIFTPMALTLASLICLIIVGMGGTNKSSSTLNNLYFFKANTSDITINASLLDLPSNALTDKLINDTTSATTTALGIKDFYTVSLWNYCSGDFATTGANTTDKVTYCSPRTSEFWFNPVQVWGLNNTGVENLFSSELKDGLDAYHTASKWMFIAYVVTVISLVLEILIGITALFSRWGSLATSIISGISNLFIMAFALTSTILYATLMGSFNSALEKYNIHGSLGHSMYVVVWLAVAFSWAAGLFWLLSSCCCSGRSDRMKGYGDGSGRKGMRAQKTPYTYERVESPLMGQSANGNRDAAATHPGPQQGWQMGNMGPQGATAYEPFRHGEV
ncbi:hypothetical protein MMC12_001463 [Toensbergia leucococca]|nr:hypothetical protein [Toensbergia leucococca]